MADVFNVAKDGWREVPDMPGWLLKTAVFDYGRRIGVCFWNGKTTDGERVRHAIMVQNTDEATALRDATEGFKDWLEHAHTA